MAIKFPLKMKNDVQVRTLEELREHFDLAAVLGYYNNGRLVEWLSVWYYDKEVEKINALDSSSDSFKKQLCDVLGVAYAENEAGSLDLKDISNRNERRERLKKFTADDMLLAAVDSVAFSQEELIALLDGGAGTVYLCGERFTIPWSIPNVTYIGVNNPKVNISDEHTGNYARAATGWVDPKVDTSAVHIGRGIVFQNLHFEIDDIIQLAKKAACLTELENYKPDYTESTDLWRIAAEHGNAEAQFNLGLRYYYGTGISKNVEETVKWYHKAAEQGYAEAQYHLGKVYYDFDSDDYEDCVVEQDYDEAFKWYRKAAEQGNAEAQCILVLEHFRGGYELSSEEMEKYAESLYNAAERGNSEAKKALISIDPKRFKLSDVIIHAVGGIENIYLCDINSINEGLLKIWVTNRNDVDKDVLNSIAVDIHVETVINTVATAGNANFNVLMPVFNQKAKIQKIDRGQGIVHMKFEELSPSIKDELRQQVESTKFTKITYPD